MSEILSNIVVEQTSINFSPNNNNLNVTPEAIQLNIFTGASPGAGQSSNGELLYNNTNLIDGVPNTSVSGGNLTFTNLANLKIAGGTNGYVLQTDGTGNLDWTAQTGNGGGNGVPGGANTQIQYNDSGAFGGNSGFTFNEVSGNVNMPSDLIVVGTITANNFVGSFSNATVGNANYANFAGNVVNAAQPNITSVGTLTALSVSNVITGTQLVSNIANGTAPLVIASQTIVANLNANLLNNATTTTSNTADTIALRDANGNISANYFIGNVIGSSGNANYANFAGTVLTNAQPNITSVGVLTDLRINNDNIHLGNLAGNASQDIYAIAIGSEAGRTSQGEQAIALGLRAGCNSQDYGAIALGTQAGQNAQGNFTVAIGFEAGTLNQSANAIAIGFSAGGNNQSNSAIAIGRYAATGSNAIGEKQGVHAIAIGSGACEDNGQDNYAIAIGFQAGKGTSAPYSVAVGSLIQTAATNAIVLNASGSNLSAFTANTFTVKPVRNNPTTNLMFYNATTGEITYGVNTSNGGNAAGLSGQVQFNAANLLAGSANFAFDSSSNTLSTDNLVLSNNANAVTINASGTISAASFTGSTVGATSVTATGNVTASVINANNYIRITPTAFANLPAATSVPGARAIINNGNTAVFNANVSGGGSNIIPVFSTGSAWRVG
jgi:hypothetical protein